MRALSGAYCTDARLYILRIKIGTRTTSARERSVLLSSPQVFHYIARNDVFKFLTHRFR